MCCTSRVARWASPSSVRLRELCGERVCRSRCSTRVAAAHLPPQSSRSRGSVAVLLRSAPQFLLCTSSARNVTERHPAAPDTWLPGTHTSTQPLHEKNEDAPRITAGGGLLSFLVLFLLAAAATEDRLPDPLSARLCASQARGLASTVFMQ